MGSRIRKKSLAELNLDTLTNFVLTPAEQDHFTRGIELFNAEKFWEAHEAWEEIWQQRPEDGRFFIQALIQLAAGYHQLRRQIYRGFVIHLRQAEERLKLFPGDFLGIDAAGLLGVIVTSLAEIDRHDTLQEVDYSLMQIPRIELVR